MSICVMPSNALQGNAGDLVSDAFTDGRRFRILTVVDNFTKENVLLVPDTSTSGQRVTREWHCQSLDNYAADVIHPL